jgi:hypothetical protein
MNSSFLECVKGVLHRGGDADVYVDLVTKGTRNQGDHTGILTLQAKKAVAVHQTTMSPTFPFTSTWTVLLEYFEEET